MNKQRDPTPWVDAGVGRSLTFLECLSVLVRWGGEKFSAVGIAPTEMGMRARAVRRGTTARSIEDGWERELREREKVTRELQMLMEN